MDARMAASVTVRHQGLMSMKTTAYFDATRSRPDRTGIKDDWILRVLRYPEKEQRQMDGRIRRWARIAA